MGDFRFGQKFLSSPIVTAVFAAGTSRAGYPHTRLCILLDMLSISVDGFCFVSSDRLCIRRGYSEAQCKAVWDVCISMGVMRKTETGYSANEWLAENGFIDPPKPAATVQAVRPVKTQCRFNVSMTLEQLSELKEKYEERQLNNILDAYSDWKVKKKCTINDDWKQITSWAAEVFKDGDNAKSGNGTSKAVLDYEQLTEIYAELGQ